MLLKFKINYFLLVFNLYKALKVDWNEVSIL